MEDSHVDLAVMEVCVRNMKGLMMAIRLSLFAYFLIEFLFDLFNLVVTLSVNLLMFSMHLMLLAIIILNQLAEYLVR